MTSAVRRTGFDRSRLDKVSEKAAPASRWGYQPGWSREALIVLNKRAARLFLGRSLGAVGE